MDCTRTGVDLDVDERPTHRVNVRRRVQRLDASEVRLHCLRHPCPQLVVQREILVHGWVVVGHRVVVVAWTIVQVLAFGLTGKKIETFAVR